MIYANCQLYSQLVIYISYDPFLFMCLLSGLIAVFMLCSVAAGEPVDTCRLFTFSHQDYRSDTSSSHRWLRTATLHVFSFRVAFMLWKVACLSGSCRIPGHHCAHFYTINVARMDVGDDVSPHCFLHVEGWRPRRPVCILFHYSLPGFS